MTMNCKGYYNDKVLDKFGNALNAAKADVKSGSDMKVRFSGGNRKMGEISSVSTLPFYTCPGVCMDTCGLKCYAAKIANLYPNVLKSYAINTAIAIYRPVEYWNQISDYVKACRYFRFHVSGDILNYAYFLHMVEIAGNNPHCEFLCFTKQYAIVNRYVSEHGDVPCNLHILFSGWQGLKPVNPYNFPETNVYTCEEDFTEDWKVCGGNCFNCACRGLGCWQAVKGDTIAFKMH